MTFRSTDEEWANVYLDGKNVWELRAGAVKEYQIHPRDFAIREVSLDDVKGGDAAANATMSSTKSSVGHLLGAAGSVEAIFSILVLRDNVIPPTLNLDNPSVQTKIDLVPFEAKRKQVDVVLSNSFGFGGTNASLVMRRVA